MKTAKTVLYVAAAFFAVYAVGMVIYNSVNYATYIDYYGFGAVLAAVLESFITPAAWAVLFFALAALLGAFNTLLTPCECECEDEYKKAEAPCAKKEEVEEAVDEVAEAVEEAAEKAEE